MKKILLLIGMVALTTVSFSQVVFYVFPEAESAGSYDLMYANDPQFTTSWLGLPDMQDPANNVTDTIAIATDIVEPFDDVCDEIANPEEIDGKIAMLWRGACTFVSKAQKCQEAGARAVIIVNHSGEPVGMNGGSEIEINIPVIMISTAAGDIIQNEINSGGTIVALIGQIQGEFANNVGAWEGDYHRFKYGAHKSNSASLSEDLVIGTMVRNYGTSEMDNVTLNAVITAGDNSIYDETSTTPVSIPVGDSIFISLPNFTGDLSGESIYTMTYTIETQGEDEFIGDNIRVLTLNVGDSNYALCRVNEDGTPVVNAGGVQPGDMGVNDSYSLCIHYRESNANNTKIDGLSFRGVTNSGDSLTGAFMTAKVWEWTDEFENLEDATFSNLAAVAIQDYSYTTDAQNENIYVEFEEPYVLLDDIRYLFCVTSLTNTIFLGTDNVIDYDKNRETYKQPLTVIENNGTWTVEGFGTDRTASIVASLSNSGVSVEENNIEEQLIAYPNPAVNEITVPFKGSNNVIAIDVFDVSGKLVMSQTMKQNSPNELKLNISELESGYYSFKALFENGKSSSFNVVVNN